jgi:hypothetical protein
MEVIPMDQRRRRKVKQCQMVNGSGKVLYMDQLSDRVLLRVVQRQAAREIEELKYLIKITGGDPTMLPTVEQMEEINNGTIEF